MFLVFFVGFFSANSQNLFLAAEYMKTGEPEKALEIYRNWYEHNRRFNPEVYNNVLRIYLNKGRYGEALAWIESMPSSARPYMREADRYHVLRLMKRSDEAGKSEQKLMHAVRRMPSAAVGIANRLRQYQYLDTAARLLREALRERELPGIYLSLGNIYAEQGRIADMMDAYVHALLANEGYFYYLTGVLSKYLTSDPRGRYNLALKKQIAARLAESPSPALLKLMQWVYVREKNYPKAFIQWRALYEAGEASAAEALELAESALENNAPETAERILRFLTENSDTGQKSRDKALWLLSRSEAVRLPINDALLNRWKKRAGAIKTPVYKQRLYALVADKLTEGFRDLKEARRLIDSLAAKETTRRGLALWREKKADIYLYEKQFDRAALEYTLLREDFPSEELNYRALYKIALASFFGGDFEWAHTVLRPLKKASGKKIANDALYLDFIIVSNRNKSDTLQRGLREFAALYFYYYTHSYDSLLTKLSRKSERNPDDIIYDDILYLKARVMLHTGHEAETEPLWQEILTLKTDKIYREEALYRLGIIFEKHKKDPAQAKKYFERLLTLYPQGYWFEEAQKHYRRIIEQNQNLP